MPPTFLTLPLELRHEIYRHLLAPPKDHDHWAHTEDAWDLAIRNTRPTADNGFYCERDAVAKDEVDAQQSSALAILQTCQQINEEASPVLYHESLFYFQVPHAIKRLPTHNTDTHLPCSLVSLSTAARIRHLILFHQKKDSYGEHHARIMVQTLQLFARYGTALKTLRVNIMLVLGLEELEDVLEEFEADVFGLLNTMAGLEMLDLRTNMFYDIWGKPVFEAVRRGVRATTVGGGWSCLDLSAIEYCPCGETIDTWLEYYGRWLLRR